MTGWERLHPRLVLVGVSWVVGPLVAALGVVLLDGVTPAAVITLASLVVTSLVVAGVVVLRWATTRYRVTAAGVEVRSGLVFRRVRTAAVDRIRGVDVVARPVHRVLGLAAVEVSTGEGRLRLDGVTRARASALRDRLWPSGREEPLAVVDRAWLKYGPLTFWSVGGVGVALGGAYRVVDAFGVEPYELGFVRGVYAWFAGLPGWVAVLALVASVVVLGACGSTAWFVETWWDFRLSRVGEAFRVRRGLLTTRSLTVDRARVRGVQVTEPLLLRLVGAARTNVIAVGVGTAEDRSSAAGSALLPPAPVASAWRVALTVVGGPAVALRRRPVSDPRRHMVDAARRYPVDTARRHPVALRRHPVAALRRRLGRVPLVVVPPVLAVGALGVPAPVFAYAAVALGVVASAAGVWLAFDAYRALGHGVDGDVVVMRSGTFARRTVVLRREGVVGWQLTRSPFQRRNDLATLTFATAAGVHAYRVRDIPPADALTLARWSLQPPALPAVRPHSPVRSST
ncbi:PH domain-containing protein [Saccharothrix sp. NPDC042600]|uniref:PH domain-containing protein n=1 Tax=Saccharothrix TaxID=2071 RepID=UPI0033E54223|nr:PH domain-containing protein [Saccharothrix mutabilis subsp. capreolus]